MFFLFIPLFCFNVLLGPHPSAKAVFDNVAPELIKRAHSDMFDMMTSVRLLQQHAKQEQAPSAPAAPAPQDVHIGTPPRAEESPSKHRRRSAYPMGKYHDYPVVDIEGAMDSDIANSAGEAPIDPSSQGGQTADAGVAES